MQYKGAIMNELYEMMEEFPSYSFGQILQTFSRRSILGKDLYSAEDREIYNAIEKAKTVELE